MPTPAMQELAGREIVEDARAAAVGQRGLLVVVRARRRRCLGAGIGGAGLQRDVDDTGLAEAVLRGQRAGDQREVARELRGQRLAEQRQSLGELHAVETVLQVGVIAAHMDLAETVLRYAGRAQQDLVERRLITLRQVIDGARAELVVSGAEAWLDGDARGIELLGRDVEIDDAAIVGGGSGRLGRGGTGERQSGTERNRSLPLAPHYSPPVKSTRSDVTI